MPEETLYSHRARVAPVALSVREKLLEVVQSRELTLDPENAFFWRAEISNGLLDSHFTRMSEKTLNNYAQDAEHGVAFLRGHNWHELPLGYSIAGARESVGDKQRVVADFYAPKTGIRDIEEMIARIQTGILRDVSVGFHGGRMVCDLCGNDFFDCRHFPGLNYEEKVGDTVTTKLSTFTIDDSRLAEVSGVFDGSTPEAMILKAERAARTGELTPQQINLLESRYRVRLPSKTVFPVPKSAGGKPMEVQEMEEAFDQLRAAVKATDNKEIVTKVAELQKRISELEPLADDGRQYRSDLIEDALKEGVRAMGNDFKQESYKGTLEKLPLAAIRQMRDDWKSLANAKLSAGRVSLDVTSTKKSVTNAIPDAFYGS